MYPKQDWETFKNFGYRDHQLIVSPLAEINTNVINLFPLDYMHLVCLGAVCRILNYMKKGPCGKISANNINEISMLLLSLNGHMPSAFVRQPRSLKDLDRWKATEFRQFLLYSGPVVLRNVLSDDAYQHFLALSITLTILLQSDVEVRSHYLEYSKQLIRQFAYNSKYIYGNTFTVYNIHNLLHLPDDCEHYGSSLNSISCFPFENFLQGLKRSVCGKSNPVVQVAKLQLKFQSIFGSAVKN